MKKIGVLTFHRAINYGAALQAYALQEKVADLGCEAEIIDYGLIGAAGTASQPVKKNILGKFLKYVLHPVSNFRLLLDRGGSLCIRKFEGLLFKKDVEKQNQSFYGFEEKYLKISKDSYHNKNDLERTDLIYDGVITGSDQVWNPLITQNDLAYFLNFLSNNNKKISYAASFGYGNISEDFQRKIVPELQSIKHLSVREAAGAEMIKKMSNRDAQVVVDPTVLLSCEEWEEMLPESKFNEPYIFCYALLDNPELKPLCEHLSKITGLKSVRLSLYPVGCQRTKEYFDKSTTYVNDSGPLEFLSYLKNASMVVTNSFHGTIFSIIFQRNFYVLLPEYSLERIVNLLDLYKLSDRLYRKGDKLPAKNDIEIDYNKVAPIYLSERNKSIEFLKKSLDSL